MSYDLAQVLQKDTPIRVIRVYVAAVDTVNRTATVQLQFGGDSVPGVTYLSNYTPVVGDYAEAMVMETRGMMLLSKVTMVAAPVAPVITPTSTTPASSAGYNEQTSQWTVATNIPVGGAQNAALFYPPAFGTGLAGRLLTGFNIKIQTFQNFDRGSLALDLLPVGVSPSAPGSYVSLSRIFTPYIPSGVLTVIPLPIAWAQAFSDATAVGIGLHSDLYETVIQTAVTNQGQLTASYTS